MRVIGFHPLDDQQAATVDKVIPAINNAVVAGPVTFHIAGFGALDLAPSNLEDMMTGADESGTPIVRLRLIADDIAELCQLYSSYCGESGNPLRHARIQISDGQVVVAGEVYIGLLNRWQALEIFPELSDGSVHPAQSHCYRRHTLFATVERIRQSHSTSTSSA